MPDEVKTWKELFDISAPVSTRLVNDVTCYHENESIQALALLGAGVALSKKSGHVTRDEFLSACVLMWDNLNAVFETEEVNLN